MGRDLCRLPFPRSTHQATVLPCLTFSASCWPQNYPACAGVGWKPRFVCWRRMGMHNVAVKSVAPRCSSRRVQSPITNATLGNDHLVTRDRFDGEGCVGMEEILERLRRVDSKRRVILPPDLSKLTHQKDALIGAGGNERRGADWRRRRRAWRRADALSVGRRDTEAASRLRWDRPQLSAEKSRRREGAAEPRRVAMLKLTAAK